MTIKELLIMIRLVVSYMLREVLKSYLSINNLPEICRRKNYGLLVNSFTSCSPKEYIPSRKSCLAALVIHITGLSLSPLIT